MPIQLSIANATSLSILPTSCFISSKSQQAVLSISMALGNCFHSQIYHPLALNTIGETPAGHSILAKPTTQTPNTHTSLNRTPKAPSWLSELHAPGSPLPSRWFPSFRAYYVPSLQGWQSVQDKASIVTQPHITHGSGLPGLRPCYLDTCLG